MKLSEFTIIIPCISFKDVSISLANIRKQYKKIKIIICLNNIDKKIPKDKNLVVLKTKFKGIGKKRNLAVDRCKTKYIAFIDSDAYPKKKWLENSFKYLNKKNIGLIGGPNIDPEKQTFTQKLIGQVKKSYLITMMPNIQKSSKEKSRYVGFLPSVNWILKRDTFNKVGQMDNVMLKNEDWDYVRKMKKKKLKVFYSSNSIVYHENNTLAHFIKKRFKYGFFIWPILTQINLLNFYFLIPFFFTLFLISTPFAIYNDFYVAYYVAIYIFYFIIIVIETFRVSKKIKYLFYNFWILLAGNLSPGAGMFIGFFNFLIKKV